MKAAIQTMPMIAQPDRNDFPPEEYLAAEAESETKHEYWDGEVIAMAGTSDSHNLITGNLYSLFRAHLRGSSCQIFFADIKVRVETANCFYYPDMLVTCDIRDREDRYVKRHPKLIVEILSDSAEAVDRRRKLHHYGELPSLQEYVLVNQARAEIDVFRRNTDRTWNLQTYTSGETVRFASLDLDCPIAEIYEDVAFESGDT